MKKLYILTCCILICLLSSCHFIHFGSNHRNNFFVAGEFEGINDREPHEKFHLVVTEISKDEYKAAKGINVVCDEYTKLYYYLELSYYDGDKKIELEYKNLTVYGTPFEYEDDYGNILTPMRNDFAHGNEPGQNYYVLNQNYKMNRDNYAFVRMY